MGQLVFANGACLGEGEGCFVIAEAGVNHNGDVALAHDLIDVAADARCDAVKFQTFKTEALVNRDAPKAEYQTQNTGSQESQYEMLKRLELPYEAHHELMAHARERGILFLSTPFDEESADFLDELGLPAFKVPSGEVTNWPLLRHLASKKKPMLMSSGMAYLSDVEGALRQIEDEVPAVALFHCVSNYPADPAEVNLRAMATMRAAFGVPVGYSDHTLGWEVTLGAVALGASLIEKHMTLDRTLPGPDHKASLEPAELKEMMRAIRSIERALGDGRKRPSPSELEVAKVAKKSLIARREIAAGETLEMSMLICKRPGVGLAPSALPMVLGRKARVRIEADTLIELKDLM